MRINSTNAIKYVIGFTLLTGTGLAISPKLKAQEPDTFEKSECVVSTSGTSDSQILEQAPLPYFEVANVPQQAKFVVDLSKNTLYKYDDFGNPTTAYLVASGKKSTPTHTGIRRITHVEKYPYSNAPESSKRRKNPQDYGPRIIFLEKIDPETGKTSSTGEFIHGNKNPKSLGQYASKGCVRMDNQVIKELAQEVKKGDYVLIIE